MNPFLTVHGPRPAAWWATCDLCGKPSQARFADAEAAAGWDHDCHTAADDDGTVTLTITVSIDEPPVVRFVGRLTHDRLDEIDHAVRGMTAWARVRSARQRFRTWNDCLVAEWEARRQRMVGAAVAEMERAVQNPFVCPECGQRCKTVGGLKNHMRACWRVDPFKFKRGEYDAAMVPGGVS